jgi:hypothetical protein
LIPCLLVDEDDKRITQDKNQFDAMSAATNDFKDVRLTVQINGIEVNPKHFIEGVERNMDYAVGRAAVELVRVKVDEIFDPLIEIRNDAEARIRKLFEDAGIELPIYEEW